MDSSNATSGGGFGGAVGAGLLGLVVGSMLNNGGGLFGNNRSPSTEAVALGAMEFMEQAGDIKESIAAASAVGAASAGATRETVLAGASEILTAQAAQNFTTLTSINGLGRDVITGQNQIQLATLNSFNGLNTNLLQSVNGLSMQSARDASAIQATLQQQNMVQAQCCCEIKQAIAVDGGLTRTLINDIRLSELQAQLTDAKLALSNSKQTNELDAKMNAMTSTIIAHIPRHHS